LVKESNKNILGHARPFPYGKNEKTIKMAAPKTQFSLNIVMWLTQFPVHPIILDWCYYYIQQNPRNHISDVTGNNSSSPPFSAIFENGRATLKILHRQYLKH